MVPCGGTLIVCKLCEILPRKLINTSLILRILQAHSLCDLHTGCVLWQGGTNGRYGQIEVEGKSWYVHRLAFTLLVKSTDLHVLHTCDTPLCWRPEHLFEGTALDNTRDMHRKGRANRPIKFSDDTVRQVRTLAGTMRHQDIADITGMTRRNVSYIIKQQSRVNV